MSAFLADRKPRPLSLLVGGITASGYHLGRDPKHNTPLEVVVATANTTEPRATGVRSFWKQRNAGRPAPLLLVVVRPDGKANVAGPVALKDDPAVSEPLELALIEQVCREALDQPNKESALRYLRDALPAVQSGIPGLRNEGFLANHTVARLPQSMTGWNDDFARRARGLVGQVDTALLRGLGFDLSPLDNLSSLLKATATGSRTAVAVVLQPDESPDLEAARFNGISPVTYAMQKASTESLRYVLVCQGPRVRLYSAEPQVGVASRSRTETFVELHSGLLTGNRAGYLLALLSSDALKDGGHFDQALASSKLYAAEVAKKLRERVYNHVIPELAKGLAEARKIKKPTAADLADTYRMAMTVLFRLLFVAYAEDKKLLPFGLNGLYDKRSLKGKAKELQSLARDQKPFDAGDNHWKEVATVFDAVAEGNREWGVPKYGGELFEKENNPHNAALAGLTLSNAIFGPALRELLLTETEHGLAPIDFTTLGVREFGTIYEGLLESELAVAEADLTTDAEGNYRPVKGKEKPVVAKGAIYLHNKSGQRKASGTYFTKPFAVDHLLDEALEPALKDHLARLDALPNDTDAAEAFFDFRCADIAMGSAHFLVAAVDRIERAFSGYLTRRRLPLVAKELADLRAAAEEKLKDLAVLIDEGQLSETQLLRRQIARRCVYGVDVNPVAVTLARLSIWIHTFVPGLPLSFLNHNLRAGNSLVGVGMWSEVEAAFRGEGPATLTNVGLEDLLGATREPLRELSKLSEATIADVKKAEKLQKDADERVKPAAALCDIVTACRITGSEFPFDALRWEQDKATIVGSKPHRDATKAMAHLPPFHFPVAFPEVFLRDRAGFDVILGNPPWEKARVEEHAFWGRHVPRLRGMNKPDREAAIAELRDEREDLAFELKSEQAQSKQFRDAIRDMPGMNTGHPDLFRAFLWRFTQLLHNHNGQLGIVLPGDAFKIAGAVDLRQTMANICASVRVQMLTNKGEWVFEDVDGRKLVAFVNAELAPNRNGAKYLIPPECHERRDWDTRDRHKAAELSFDQLREYSDSLVIPVLRSVQCIQLIQAFMQHPRILANPTLRVRRVYADFETSKQDKAYWHKDRKPGDWPVYAGEAFDIWNPDTGKYYAFTNAKVIRAAAHDKWQRANRTSPYSLLPAPWRKVARNHPINRPRIAFRDVSNRTNTRTLLVSLIPPEVITLQQAPWVLWTDPDHPTWHEAYLLGVLSSLPLDWWCRRFVEGHADQEAFNCLRIPDPANNHNLVQRVVALAGRLAAVDDRYAEWAAQVDVECGPLDATQKDDHIHELDAVVAHLYGLSEAHLRHVFETFHEGWDYHDRLAHTLKWFRKWQ